MVPVALHIVTESADHYNFLLEFNPENPKEIIEKLCNDIYGEMAHICQFYVDTNNDVYDSQIYDLIQEARAEAYIAYCKENGYEA